MRYFIDGAEVTLQQAQEAERSGAAKVVTGGSGVVPERLRQLGETPQEYLVPWLEMKAPGNPCLWCTCPGNRCWRK